jgi:hypothetical protein
VEEDPVCDSLANALDSLRSALQEAQDGTIDAWKITFKAGAVLEAVRTHPTLPAEIEQRLTYWDRVCHPDGELAKAAAIAVPALQDILANGSLANDRCVQTTGQFLLNEAKVWWGERPDDWVGSAAAGRQILDAMGLLFAIGEDKQEPLMEWRVAISEAISDADRLRVDALEWLADAELEDPLRNEHLAISVVKGLFEAADTLEDMANDGSGRSRKKSRLPERTEKDSDEMPDKQNCHETQTLPDPKNPPPPPKPKPNGPIRGDAFCY